MPRVVAPCRESENHDRLGPSSSWRAPRTNLPIRDGKIRTGHPAGNLTGRADRSSATPDKAWRTLGILDRTANPGERKFSSVRLASER